MKVLEQKITLSALPGLTLLDSFPFKHKLPFKQHHCHTSYYTQKLPRTSKKFYAQKFLLFPFKP